MFLNFASLMRICSAQFEILGFAMGTNREIFLRGTIKLCGESRTYLEENWG